MKGKAIAVAVALSLGVGSALDAAAQERKPEDQIKMRRGALTGVVSHLDVHPTIMRFLGLPPAPPQGVDGRVQALDETKIPFKE